MSDQLRNFGYQEVAKGCIGAGNMPREIGIIDRVQGLNGGISDLYGRLSSLIERVEGSGSAGAKANPLPAPGLSNVLSDAEANLRGCMELVGQLNAKL
jgi:hypothetical protein